MGERTSYEPGTFSWVDLGTTDQEAAKAFYSALFGWSANDIPVGDDTTYSIMEVRGKAVAAIATQQEDERKMGVPPHWNSYVTVADADETVEAVDTAGGTTLAEPFDVLDVGRMAVIQDPTGAVLCIWEPRRHIGAELVNAPGALVWNEHASTNPEQAKAFYGMLFDWEFQLDPSGYTMIYNRGRMNGGMRKQTEQEEGIPAHWLAYFAVDDTDASVQTALDNNGRVLLPATDIGVARIAVVADPQGAAFAIYAGRLDP
jgi:predicted enzyme related to lactoylglutathione lyase